MFSSAKFNLLSSMSPSFIKTELNQSYQEVYNNNSCFNKYNTFANGTITSAIIISMIGIYYGISNSSPVLLSFSSIALVISSCCLLYKAYNFMNKRYYHSDKKASSNKTDTNNTDYSVAIKNDRRDISPPIVIENYDAKLFTKSLSENDNNDYFCEHSL
mgnify:CR=1 FL=1